MSEKKEMLAAKLTIRNAAKMTSKERADVVAWLLEFAGKFPQRANQFDANYSALLFLPPTGERK